MAESPFPRPLTEDEVLYFFSEEMRDLWKAAAACLEDHSETAMEEFRRRCYPAKIMHLMRMYAEFRT